MKEEIVKVEAKEITPASSQAVMVTTVLEVISKAAANPEVDIDKMERLLVMQEKMVSKQEETEYNIALSIMQSNLPVIQKNGVIADQYGNERSRFAKFEDINEAVKPVMKENGFALSFRVANNSNTIDITGILMHKSGHREETTFSLPSDVSGKKNQVQAMGSSISYGKRYVMSALLNITATDEDDDGEGGDDQNLIDESQVFAINNMIAGDKLLEEQVCSFCGVYKIHQIPSSLYENVFNKLSARGKKCQNEN